MRALKLTNTKGKMILLNCDNIAYVEEIETHFGDKISEVHFTTRNNSVAVQETVNQIEIEYNNYEKQD